MTQNAPAARFVRALTKDQHIRISALDASPLWDGLRRGHPHLEAPACASLTELLGAVALLQSRTHMGERIQLLVRGSGRARNAVADCWPDGTIRGFLDVSDAPAAGGWIEAPGLLQVMRSTQAGQPYIGNLELVEGPLPVQIEAYLQQSEQVQASVTLWCGAATGEAGGLLVEPLPGCPPQRLARLVQALDGLEVVPLWERNPEFLLEWISQGEGVDVLAAVELFYRCRCSRGSILESLSGFTRERLEELFGQGGPVEVRCDYCGKAYPVARQDIPGPEEAHG